MITISYVIASYFDSLCYKYWCLL